MASAPQSPAACCRGVVDFSLSGPGGGALHQSGYLDKVFLNVVGLDVERGATTLEADEAVIFRAMQRQAREVIAVATTQK